MARLLYVCAALLAVATSAAAQEPKQETKQAPRGPELREGWVLERDIEYGRAGDRALLLDVIRPEAAPTEPLPVVAFIHGGGWQNGDKAGAINGPLRPVAETGNYVCVSIGYRLSGEAVWPAQIHDCKAAIRWLRANASRLGIDPDRIGVWGSSAGGHLVSLLGTSGDVSDLEGDNGSAGQSSRVNCVVDYCGPSDFLAFFKNSTRMQSADSPTTKLFGGPVPDKADAARLASPATHVSPDDPPFLVVHGTDDKTVPLSQAELFSEALQKASVDVTFVRMVGGGHGIGGPEITARVLAFFDKHLRGQQVDVSAEPIPVAAN